MNYEDIRMYIENYEKYCEKDKLNAFFKIINDIKNDKYKKLKFDQCLKENCNEKSIYSHSISQVYLKNMYTDDNKDYNYQYFNFPRNQNKKFFGEIKLVKGGIKKNSGVFKGLCKNCDNQIFQKIETKNELDFYKLSSEQKFLFMYKAFFKEFYEVIFTYNNNLKSVEKIDYKELEEFESFYKNLGKETIENIMIITNNSKNLGDNSIDCELYKYFENNNINLEDVLKFMLLMKKYGKFYYLLNLLYRKLKNSFKYNEIMSDILLNENYHMINTKIFIIDKTLPFSICSPIELLFDLKGNKVIDIILKEEEYLGKEMYNRTKDLYFNVISYNHKAYIIISYLKEDGDTFNDYISQLDELYNNNRDNFYKYLSILFSLSCDNICLRKDYLKAEAKEQFEEYSKKIVNIYKAEDFDEIKDILINYSDKDIKFNLFD